MTYQKTTGTLSPGGHPGSYNGQDAYNDMLVTDDGKNDIVRRGGETSQTLDASYYKGPGSRNGKEREVIAVEEPTYMSDRKGHNAVSEDGTAATLTKQEDERPLIGTSVVRRLTPLECERLQGYPDGWTDIGDWVDSKGKKHKAADSPRYKALGNSIALPFWFWLLRRISAQYERPATLGSLFDGIGGFPLCWERCNGKGTAVWASEIEEFAIAVTKKHFPDENQEGENL